jgi:hypothetical protein
MGAGCVIFLGTWDRSSRFMGPPLYALTSVPRINDLAASYPIPAAADRRKRAPHGSQPLRGCPGLAARAVLAGVQW